ncbi:unnamed protein product, partial [Mesorhabditis spiculigera]
MKLLVVVAAVFLIAQAKVEKPHHQAKANKVPSHFNEPTPPTLEIGDEDYADPDNDKAILARSAALENGGDLGHHLFGIMSTLGIARRLGRKPIFALRAPYFKQASSNALWDLARNFPGLIPPQSIDVKHTYGKSFWPAGEDDLKLSGCCRFVDPEKSLKNKDRATVRFEGGYLQSYKYFQPYRGELNEKLLGTLFTKMSQSLVSQEALGPDVERICIHTQRGSFLGNYHQASTFTFVRAAAQEVEGDNSIILLFGDDKTWMKQLAQKLDADGFDVEVAGKDGVPRVSELFFFRQYCDKVVISASSSTFGWWAAYFSQMKRAHVPVFYNQGFAKDPTYVAQLKAEDYYLPGWKALDLPNGTDDN